MNVNNSGEVIEKKEESPCNPVEANNLFKNNDARTKNQSYMLPKKSVRIQKTFDTLTEQMYTDNNNDQYVSIDISRKNNLLSKIMRRQ